MPSFRSLLLRHGYPLLGGYVFAAQAGFPIPADPLLLIMGAMVGDHRYALWLSILTATLGCVAGDWIWYELGRSRGRSVLSLLCKLSLEPDTCVRKTEVNFSKQGARTLLVAKFIPGISLMSSALSGATRISRQRFLLFDGAGAALWCAAYLVAGDVMHRQLDWVLQRLGLFSQRAGAVALVLILLYVAFKFVQRWRFRRELRINRIAPEDLLRLMEAGEAVSVIDLRNPAEIQEEGIKIAGAIILRPEELAVNVERMDLTAGAILYCS